jgi:hypothetical protein
MPEYIADRIRQCPPAGVRIVPNPTPVIAFGDIRKAKVATLGWNPSKSEFLDFTGHLLEGSRRRLVTTRSLINDGLTPTSDAGIAKVFDGCNGYFQRCPYGRWFDVLEKVLEHARASYYDGSACHLDPVQWATDPVWGKLEPREQELLLKADIPFLRQQLAQEGIHLLLLNGVGIMRAFTTIIGGNLKEVDFREAGRVRIFSGTTTARVMVIGWNINLQSSFGVSNAEITLIGRTVSNFSNLAKNISARRYLDSLRRGRLPTSMEPPKLSSP